MSPPSGFVPIPFHKVGKLLIAIGIAGMALILGSRFMIGLTVPGWTWVMSLLSVAVGAYLLVFVPREGEQQ
ncbi:MAG: hypothetical protein WBR18_15465 [Anaerolineales bacterium]